MAYAHGGVGGPFAWLWCLLYFDLLSKIYGPWVPFIALTLLAATMMTGLIVLAVASNSQQNEPASNTNPSERSHAYQYEFWWFELIFLATFVIVLVVPVVRYNSDSQSNGKNGVAPGIVSAKKSDEKNEIGPQRPLLSIPEPTSIVAEPSLRSV